MNSEVQYKLLKFFSKYKKKQLKKGTIFISPDQKIKGVYFLIKGTVRVFLISKNGVEITVNIFKSPSFFPMNWALNNNQNRHFYDCLSNCDLYLSPKKEFNVFFKSNHDLVLDLLERIYQGLEWYMLRIESLIGGDAHSKLLSHLLIQAKRSNQDLERVIKLRLSHTYLATETGLSRETVTREMKKLKDRGIINYQGNTLLIFNLSVLEKELSSSL